MLLAPMLALGSLFAPHLHIVTTPLAPRGLSFAGDGCLASRPLIGQRNQAARHPLPDPHEHLLINHLLTLLGSRGQQRRQIPDDPLPIHHFVAQRGRHQPVAPRLVLDLHPGQGLQAGIGDGK